MNKFIRAITSLDKIAVTAMLERDKKWQTWSEPDGKNALHYLCGIRAGEHENQSLEVLQTLFEWGYDINSVHRIADANCGIFPATSLWYAYARGRNRLLYTWLLKNGANPENCMFAIAWNDDVETAELFRNHGANITDNVGRNTPFLAAFGWKRMAMVKWFLEQGADPNLPDEHGNPAIYYAVKSRRKYGVAEIELLLKYGADFELENAAGVSAIELARTTKRTDVLRLFE